MNTLDRPLHCLQYVDALRLEQGGIVRSVIDLATVLAEQGARVTVLSGDDSDAPDSWRSSDGIGVPRVVRINRHLNPVTRSSEDQRALEEVIGEVDLVHLHAVWDPFHPTVAKAARRADKPYLLTAHGALDNWCFAQRQLKKSVFLWLVARRLLERAGRVHYTATVEQEQSQARAPLSTPLVMPLIVDLTPFRRLPGPDLSRETFPEAFSGDGAKLLFVGRLHPIKGLDLLIEALGSVSTPGPAPHLLLAGPYEDAYRLQLEKQAESLGLRGRVHFLGMVHGEVKHSLYQSCDAFVLPSHHENFGIALAEAMVCGAPVLLTKSVNIWPEIEGLGGVVVDRTVAGLRDGVQRVVAEQERLQQTGLDNCTAVLEWLDPQRLAGEYLRVYEKVIAESQQRISPR